MVHTNTYKLNIAQQHRLYFFQKLVTEKIKKLDGEFLDLFVVCDANDNMKRRVENGNNSITLKYPKYFTNEQYLSADV